MGWFIFLSFYGFLRENQPLKWLDESKIKWKIFGNFYYMYYINNETIKNITQLQLLISTTI